MNTIRVVAAAICLAVISTWSCAPVQGAGLCTLLLSLGQAGSGGESGLAAMSRGVVFDPMPPAAGLRAYLSGSGPGEEGFSEIEMVGGQLELCLKAGTWRFAAALRDGDGRAYLRGEVELFLSPAEEATARILCSPLSGLGVMALRYPPLDELPVGASWDCSLANDRGAAYAAWIDEPGIGGRELASLPAGYYRLTTILRAPGGVLGASVDAIRILADLSTSVEPSARPGQGSGLIDIELDLRSPPAVQARLASRRARRGLPALVVADGPAGEYSWYVMGRELGRGASAWIDTSGLASATQLEYLMRAADGRLGAGELSLAVQDGAVAGPWRHYLTLSELDEPDAAALAQPIGLAASPYDGSFVMLSDATSSRIDLWETDSATLEPYPRAQASVRVAGTARRATVLAYAPGGDWVAAANGDSDWIWLAPIQRAADAPPSIGPATEFRSATAGLEGLRYVRALAFNPAGDQLYALCNQSRAVFRFDLSAGAWSLGSMFALDDYPCGALSGYRALAVSHDGSLLALAAASSDTLALFDLGPGGLAWRGMLAGAAQGIDYPLALAFSPDDRALAVASRDLGLSVLSCSGAPTLLAIRGPEAGVVGEPRDLGWARPRRFPEAGFGEAEAGLPSVIALAHGAGLTLFQADGEGDELALPSRGAGFSASSLGLSDGAHACAASGAFFLAAGRMPGALALVAAPGASDGLENTP